MTRGIGAMDYFDIFLIECSERGKRMEEQL